MQVISFLFLCLLASDVVFCRSNSVLDDICERFPEMPICSSTRRRYARSAFNEASGMMSDSVRSDICSRFPELSWCNDAQTRLKNPSISVQQMSDINSADKVRYCRTYEKSFYDNCSAPIRTDYNRIKFCKAYFNYCDMADKLAPLRKSSPQ